ncbi:hypothetical protein CP533_5901 [Ophiocordyceps camponoti-saundersi (nom. inval.)]|nr:hypothetical protein CP533_5901 [Ophiocordyceps camponoti-saundersi (nom. inval.)]
MPRQAAANGHRLVYRPVPALSPPIEEPRFVRWMGFYAGPLEGHRRVGRRRHMTCHIEESPTFPLIWRWDVPPATNKPQWQPPTTAEYRRLKNQPSTTAKFISRFISWLKTVADIVFPEAEAEASPVQTSLPEEIALLRRIVCRSEEMISTKRLFELCKGCEASIWARVKRGELSLPLLDAFFEPLDLATKARIPSRVANSMTIMIRNTLVRAVGYVERRDDHSISADLWLAIADRICNVENGVHDLFLFSRLICLMPVSLHENISSERIAQLGFALVLALTQAEQCLVSSRRLDQFVKFNEALGRLTETRRHEIYDMIKSHVLRQQQHDNIESRQRLRFSWLLLRALDGQASISHIVEACHAVMEPGTRLDSLQLWHLSAARLLVKGALPSGQTVSTMPSMLMSRRWTILIRAVLPSKHCDAQLRELCSFLADVDGFQTMALALGNLPFQDMPMDGVQMNLVLAVARVCDRHTLALQLYDAFLLKRRSKEELAAWNWTHWAKYVESIIKDPYINPRWVWKVLRNMTHNDENKDDCSGDAAGTCPAVAAPEVQTKMNLLIKMGQWMLEASHLTDRQVLRGLTRCASYQRQLTGKIAPSTLVHLAQVIVRDLQRGQPGRTSRLNWLLDLCEMQEQADAKKMADLLRDWRSVNIERYFSDPRKQDAW